MSFWPWSLVSESKKLAKWIAVTYATVIVFEVVKVLLASERPVRETLLGSKKGS